MVITNNYFLFLYFDISYGLGIIIDQMLSLKKIVKQKIYRTMIYNKQNFNDLSAKYIKWTKKIEFISYIICGIELEENFVIYLQLN